MTRPARSSIGWRRRTDRPIHPTYPRYPRYPQARSPRFPLARLGPPGHIQLSRSRRAGRKRHGLPRRRQCREGRYPSGRRPGTLWWGSREEARGGGETQSRTHFSGVRQNRSLRAKELRKAARRACSKGDRKEIIGFARRGTDGREIGFARWERAEKDNRRLAGKMSRMVAGSPERRPNRRKRACSWKSEGMIGACFGHPGSGPRGVRSNGTRLGTDRGRETPAGT